MFSTIRNIKGDIAQFRKKLKNFDRSQTYLQEIESMSEAIDNT